MERTMSKMKRKKKKDTWFDYLNILLMLFVAAVTLYPFWNQMMISISSTEDIYSTGLLLIPKKISLASYRVIMDFRLLWKGYLNTVIRTVLGTAISIFLTLLTAYPLSKKNLPFRKAFTAFILVTMFFGGGLVPNFLLIRNLHLLDTIWALVLPGCISTFNVLIVRNYLMTLPEALEEAAIIDGASQFTVLMKIVLPLSVPVLATVSLWIAVGHWQAWYDNLLYINTPEKWGFMMMTRKIVVENTSVGNMQQLMSSAREFVDQRQMQGAVIMMSVIPMLIVYPFIQKYFVKGIVMGAVK